MKRCGFHLARIFLFEMKIGKVVDEVDLTREGLVAHGALRVRVESRRVGLLLDTLGRFFLLRT